VTLQASENQNEKSKQQSAARSGKTKKCTERPRAPAKNVGLRTGTAFVSAPASMR